MLRLVHGLIICLLVAACSRLPAYPEAPFDGASVRIPLDRIIEGAPVFYTFSGGGKRINYFVLREDGGVQSYFDACARCYARKMGYRTERGRVYCRACDVTYATHDLKEGMGSCYPIKLEGAVQGSTYVISRDQLLKGLRLF